MRECNKCGKVKKPHKFKHDNKKTCLKCETRWWRQILRSMVLERRLNPVERIANRLGYMGSAFIMMSPYLITEGNTGFITYIIGALLSIPQVWVGKQWNVVILNINLLIGYGSKLF